MIFCLMGLKDAIALVMTGSCDSPLGTEISNFIISSLRDLSSISCLSLGMLATKASSSASASRTILVSATSTQSLLSGSAFWRASGFPRISREPLMEFHFSAT